MNVRDDTLIEYFVFPEETKAACQQYLSYFSQFLRDLGIDSDTEIKEEANRVLFSVTPKDGIEGLEAVREALAVYLKLPALREEERKALVPSSEIAGIQLQSTVLHLQSQLMLAQAAVQMQSVSLHSQNQMLDTQAATIRMFQVVAQNQMAPDSEPLVGRDVDVTKGRQAGLGFDFPEMLRKLKRRFSRPAGGASSDKGNRL